MKKLFFALCALALIVTACKEPVKPIDLDVEDGVYVFGEATGFDKVDALLLMANGINEAKDQTARDGMFEKYIVLEGGKEFSLLWLNAGTQTYYGANLAEFTPAETSGIYADNPATAIYKGKLEIGESAPVYEHKHEAGAYEQGIKQDLIDMLPDSQKIIWAQILAPVNDISRGEIDIKALREDFNGSDKYRYTFYVLNDEDDRLNAVSFPDQIVEPLRCVVKLDENGSAEIFF